MGSAGQIINLRNFSGQWPQTGVQAFGVGSNPDLRAAPMGGSGRHAKSIMWIWSSCVLGDMSATWTRRRDLWRAGAD